MSPANWLDLGSLVAGVVIGALGALGGVRLAGKAPPRGDGLR